MYCTCRNGNRFQKQDHKRSLVPYYYTSVPKHPAKAKVPNYWSSLKEHSQAYSHSLPPLQNQISVKLIHFLFEYITVFNYFAIDLPSLQSRTNFLFNLSDLRGEIWQRTGVETGEICFNRSERRRGREIRESL